MSRAQVVHVDMNTDEGGLMVRITVMRFPHATIHLPRAEDVPNDIREAVREWLAEADKGGTDVPTA